MTDWDVPDPFAPPRKKPGGTRSALVLAGLGAVFLVVLAVFAWVASPEGGGPARWLRPRGEPGPARIQSVDAKAAELTAAFGRKPLDAGQSRYAPVVRLFDRVVKTCDESNHSAFVRLVDVDRFLESMEASGVMTPRGAINQVFDRQWVRASLSVPAVWDRYRLIYVDFDRARGGATAYGHFWGPGGEYPVRWWIDQNGAAWKIVDWELLDYGIRASTEYAIYYEHADEPGMRAYERCCQTVAASDQLRAQGDYDKAAKRLRSSHDPAILPELADDAWQQIGNAWLGLEEVSEAWACFRKLQRPEAAPGAIYGRAVCEQHWGRHRRALEEATRYEELVGPNPPASRLRAEELLTLGRPAEAVEALQRVLDVVPDDLDALEMLAEALADDELEALTDHVGGLEDAAATAESLGTSLAWRRPAAAEALADLIDQRTPGAAAAIYLRGLARHEEEDYDRAAGLFLQARAATDDDDLRRQYQTAYLDAMLMTGRVAEAYRNAPERAEAFEYLADACLSGDYAVADGALEGLIAEHRRHAPDDPWIGYYQGVLLAWDEKHEEAERVFAAVMDATDDEEVLSAVQYERAAAMAALGKGLDAYRVVGPSEEIFRQLADGYRWNDTEESAFELDALVAAHRGEFPDDPWLDYYAGLAARKQKIFGRADRLFRRAMEQAEDEWLRSRCREARLDARLESGSPLDEVLQEDPTDERFDGLASRLIAADDWDRLAELVEAYHVIRSDSAALRRRRAELLWHRDDYAGVIETLSPWPEEIEHGMDEWEASSLRATLVRSFLRTGRTAEALPIAKALEEDEGDPFPLTLVYADQGEVDRCLALAREYAPAPAALGTAYYDAEVAAALWSEAFQPLRREFPPALQSVPTTGSAVLLLDKAPELGEPEIRDRLAPILGDDLETAALEAASPGASPRRFLFSADETAFCVSLAAGPFDRADGAGREGPDSDRLRQILAEHRGWLSIDASTRDVSTGAMDPALIYRLAAVAAPRNCLAVYFPDQSRLVPMDPALHDALVSDDPTQALPELGEVFWLYYTGGDVAGATEKTVEGEPQPDRAPTLGKLERAFAAREPGTELVVTVEVTFGRATERLKLAVERIVHGYLTPEGCVGRVLEDSVLMPRYRRGESLFVVPYEIAAWEVARVR